MPKDKYNPYRPHPWHGLAMGDEAPAIVNAFIEITPFDLVKYEIDKHSGYLTVDRPQRSSSQPPVLYGFIPRTLCGDNVCKLSNGAERADGDPLDICVISERPVTKSEVIMRSRVIGGLQLRDGDEADDKIIAVLNNDNIWSDARSLDDVPTVLIERLEHYFATYKMQHGKANQIIIDGFYQQAHALAVINAATRDYAAAFGSDELTLGK